MEINNKKEFEEFYPYDKQYIDEYPKEYPCIVRWDTQGGGLMGDYKQVYIAYYPNNLSPNKSFEEGLFYEWELLK